MGLGISIADTLDANNTNLFSICSKTSKFYSESERALDFDRLGLYLTDGKLRGEPWHKKISAANNLKAGRVANIKCHKNFYKADTPLYLFTSFQTTTAISKSRKIKTIYLTF